MQQSKYGKAYCTAPNFSKEEAIPVGSQLCEHNGQFSCQSEFNRKIPLGESFWSILREEVFFTVQFLNSSVCNVSTKVLTL